MLSRFWIFILFIVCHVDPQNMTTTQMATTTDSTEPQTTVFTTDAPSNITTPPERTLCFISEQMRREVQIYHVIAVRKVDKRFKIFNGPDSFDSSFFYPKKTGKKVTAPPTQAAPVSNQTVNSTTTATNFTGPNQPTPINQTIVDGITLSWDTKKYDFHFVVPDQAYRRYKINMMEYTKKASVIGLPLNAIRPDVRYWNVTDPYTCHYNVHTNNTVCISILNKMVTVGQYSSNKKSLPKETRFLLPNYLSFDSFFSYADYQGTDYILIHHRGQWIYRINYQQYLENRQMFFKVFHLRTPPVPPFQFNDFVFADENGLITRYLYISENGRKNYRYYYSLFSEVSGLKTYCVHDKFIDGSLMILAAEMAPSDEGVAAALRAPLGVTVRQSMEMPTMLRLLFYCATIYFTIFLGTQLVPVRKAAIWRDVRRADREIQRLAPVIENIMARVYVFMENEKKMSGKKDN